MVFFSVADKHQFTAWICTATGVSKGIGNFGCGARRDPSHAKRGQQANQSQCKPAQHRLQQYDMLQLFMQAVFNDIPPLFNPMFSLAAAIPHLV